MANADNPNGFRFSHSLIGEEQLLSGTLESGQTGYQGDILVMDFTSGKLNIGSATSDAVWGVLAHDKDASAADKSVLYYPAVPWNVFDVQTSGAYAITLRGSLVDVETAGSGTFEANEDSEANPLIQILGEVDGTEIGANSRIFVRFVKSQYIANYLRSITSIPEGAFVEEVTGNKTLDAEDCGKYMVATADAVITLPATAAGNSFNIVNGAPANTITLQVSPNALDLIDGVDLTAADDKDLINTKATSRQGDMVKLIADGTTGWFVNELVGTWAREA